MEEGGAPSNRKCESPEEMTRRHKAEVRELEGRIRAMLKGAKKAQRAELEAKAIQMEMDLKAKHREEEDDLDELVEKLGGLETVFSDGGGGGGGGDKKTSAEEEAAQARAKEEADAAARRAKAQKKKDKSKAKEAEREARKEEIANSAGPNLRQVELDAINVKLRGERFVVKEIISDGNCLYRAFADQLKFTATTTTESVLQPSFERLRVMAAEFMTAHPDDFAPFLGLDADSVEFRDYVANVARCTGEVEWGGQLEIRALCGALRRATMVYDSNAPVLTMGEDFLGAGPVLRLSYHRHYFSLGEHYNSVAPAPATTAE